MHLLGIGDNVVDRYLDRETMYPGGNAVNVAVFAKRAGVQASYQGVVGTDPAGNLIVDALKREGVDVSRIRVASGPNAFANVRIVDGEREFVGSEDGVSEFELSSVELEGLSGFDIAHTAASGSLYSQVEAMATRVRVSFDFSKKRDEHYIKTIAPYLELASFSASDLSENDATSLLYFACSVGARVALATRGALGSLLYDGERLYQQEAIPAIVADTLGAGDAYIARVLIGIVGAEPFPKAMSAAAKRAAEVCAAQGAFGYGQPTASARSSSDVPIDQGSALTRTTRESV